MIDCTITRDKRKRTLVLSGHAGEGHSDVCVAVSVLCAALDASCQTNGCYQSSGTAGSGGFSASYTGYNDKVHAAFDMAETGFRLISKKYPECIDIKTVKRQTK